MLIMVFQPKNLGIESQRENPNNNVKNGSYLRKPTTILILWKMILIKQI